MFVRMATICSYANLLIRFFCLYNCFFARAVWWPARPPPRRKISLAGKTTTRGPTFMCGCACVDGSPSGHLSKLERYREAEHGLCVRMQAHNIEGREIRTPNLLIWIFCRGKRDLSDGVIEFLKKQIMVSVNMFCPMVRPALS